MEQSSFKKGKRRKGIVTVQRDHVRNTRCPYVYEHWHQNHASRQGGLTLPFKQANPDLVADTGEAERLKRNLRIQAIQNVMRNYIIELTSQEYNVYKFVIIEGQDSTSVAAVLGVSKQRVTQLVQSIGKRHATGFKQEYEKLCDEYTGMLDVN